MRSISRSRTKPFTGALMDYNVFPCATELMVAGARQNDRFSLIPRIVSSAKQGSPRLAAALTASREVSR